MPPPAASILRRTTVPSSSNACSPCGTAPRSFFRMYEGFCAHHDEYIGYETEYFWYRNDPAWTPEMMPDPREFGELAAGEEGERQLAVLASLAEALADAFNWRYMHGFRRDRNHVEPTIARGPPVYKAVFKGPAWAASVRACLSSSSSTWSTPSGRPSAKTTWSRILATCAPSGSEIFLSRPGRCGLVGVRQGHWLVVVRALVNITSGTSR